MINSGHLDLLSSVDYCQPFNYISDLKYPCKVQTVAAARHRQYECAMNLLQGLLRNS